MINKAAEDFNNILISTPDKSLKRTKTVLEQKYKRKNIQTIVRQRCYGDEKKLCESTLMQKYCTDSTVLGSF